jgi:hypothetical protein
VNKFETNIFAKFKNMDNNLNQRLHSEAMRKNRSSNINTKFIESENRNKTSNGMNKLPQSQTTTENRNKSANNNPTTTTTRTNNNNNTIKVVNSQPQTSSTQAQCKPLMQIKTDPQSQLKTNNTESIITSNTQPKTSNVSSSTLPIEFNIDQQQKFRLNALVHLENFYMNDLTADLQKFNAQIKRSPKNPKDYNQIKIVQIVTNRDAAAAWEKRIDDTLNKHLKKLFVKDLKMPDNLTKLDILRQSKKLYISNQSRTQRFHIIGLREHVEQANDFLLHNTLF